ncbi:TetR family transcriptional regulator, partial [Kitasatospora sp. NPDC056789]
AGGVTAALGAPSAAPPGALLPAGPRPGGAHAPEVETAMDRLVAPLMYRILFRPSGLTPAYARHLVTDLLGTPDGA